MLVSMLLQPERRVCCCFEEEASSDDARVVGFCQEEPLPMLLRCDPLLLLKFWSPKPLWYVQLRTGFEPYSPIQNRVFGARQIFIGELEVMYPLVALFQELFLLPKAYSSKAEPAAQQCSCLTSSREKQWLDKSPHVRRNSDHNPLFHKVDSVSLQSGYYSVSGPWPTRCSSSPWMSKFFHVLH